MDAALAQWFKSLPGRRITRLVFARFVADNRAVSLDEVCFELDGLPAGKIDCAADGESLRYSPLGCAEVDVGEYGARKLFDRIDSIAMGKIDGELITGVVLILDNDVFIGAGMKFSNGSELMILNCGDNLSAVLDSDHPMLREPTVTRRAFA